MKFAERPFPQKLFPQDTLTVDLSGSSTSSDIDSMSMLIYYPDLPGADGRFFSPADVLPRVKHLVTVENTITEDTTGAYSGSEALNAEFDLLKSNTDYALLGYTFFETGDLNVCSVAFDAPDWANLRIGGPGIGEGMGQLLTKDWFIRISRAFNLPLVPVFASGNVANVNVSVLTDENGKTPIVTSILGELGPAPQRQALR